MLRGRAQWFGAATSAAGLSVDFALDDGGLVLTHAQGETHVALGDVTVVRGGFDATQLSLSWRDSNGGESRLQLNAATAQALLATPPAALAAQLNNAHAGARGVQRRFRIGATLVGVFVASPLLLLLAFWHYSDRIAAFVVSHISIETERKLGDAWFAQMKPRMTFVERGAAVDAIKQIGAQLENAERLPYPLHWYVVRDKAVNAFAAPGGYVVVYIGLIEAADSAEEVAGVLAHELQHVAQRHSLKAMVRDTGWRVAWSLAVGDVSGAGNLAQQLSGLQFSRQQEAQADREGFALLQRAAIDPRGMIRFFDKLAQQDGNSVALLSSHPASAERKNALEAALHENPTAFPPLRIDWNAVKASIAQR